MAFPHHRHQSSLEGVIDLSSPQPLEPDQRDRATRIFNQIVAHFEPSQTEDKGYKRVTLIRTVHEYTINRDNFLHCFFLHVEKELRPSDDASELSLSQALSRFDYPDSWNDEQRNELSARLAAFADYLVDNFFLPLKASALKTPQPTPASLSEAQPSHEVAGSTQRLSNLRRDCLIRDGHRCVISQKFDIGDAMKRVKRDKNNAKDDDGRLLINEREAPEYLEVAHILPHSLTSLAAGSGDSQLSESKKIALQILNMFDPGLVHLIDGPNIDRPVNALTLTLNFHRLFGSFEICFEPTTDQAQYTYKIDYVQSNRPFRDPLFPVTRTLHLTPDHTIDPPSSRLLAIHCAIGHILNLSGAGDYIDDIIQDMDEVGIKENGSTGLGHYVSLKLGGWLDGVPVC